jgi:hypothetical protein
MSFSDLDIAGFRKGKIRILINDWIGPRSGLDVGSQVCNPEIALRGWIDDPYIGPLGDIEEGCPDSIYSFKKSRINISLVDHERDWSFEIPSGVVGDFSPIRGVCEIHGGDDHSMHNSLDGVAIFYLAVQKNCWDVLMQCLLFANLQNRLHSWDFTYLIRETDLNPSEKDTWDGWGSSRIRGVRPKHFDTTQIINLGIIGFDFGNTRLDRD